MNAMSRDLRQPPSSAPDPGVAAHGARFRKLLAAAGVAVLCVSGVTLVACGEETEKKERGGQASAQTPAPAARQDATPATEEERRRLEEIAAQQAALALALAKFNLQSQAAQAIRDAAAGYRPGASTSYRPRPSNGVH